MNSDCYIIYDVSTSFSSSYLDCINAYLVAMKRSAPKEITEDTDIGEALGVRLIILDRIELLNIGLRYDDLIILSNYHSYYLCLPFSLSTNFTPISMFMKIRIYSPIDLNFSEMVKFTMFDSWSCDELSTWITHVDMGIFQVYNTSLIMIYNIRGIDFLNFNRHTLLRETLSNKEVCDKIFSLIEKINTSLLRFRSDEITYRNEMKFRLSSFLSNVRQTTKDLEIIMSINNLEYLGSVNEKWSEEFYQLSKRLTKISGRDYLSTLNLINKMFGIETNFSDEIVVDSESSESSKSNKKIFCNILFTQKFKMSLFKEAQNEVIGLFPLIRETLKRNGIKGKDVDEFLHNLLESFDSPGTIGARKPKDKNFSRIGDLCCEEIYFSIFPIPNKRKRINIEKLRDHQRIGKVIRKLFREQDRSNVIWRCYEIMRKLLKKINPTSKVNDYTITHHYVRHRGVQKLEIEHRSLYVKTLKNNCYFHLTDKEWKDEIGELLPVDVKTKRVIFDLDIQKDREYVKIVKIENNIRVDVLKIKIIVK